MKRYFCFIALVLLLANSTVSANNYEIEGGESAAIGVYIKSLDDNRVIVNENASIGLTPASVTKIVTSATCLNILGPDFRFKTKVSLSGELASKGIWNGNLIIEGSGDPSIDNPDMKLSGFTDSIIASLKQNGISTIKGSIIIKDNMPDAGPIPQWEVEDIAWPYGAGLYGFNYAGNFVKVFPNSGRTVPQSSLEIELRSSDRTDLLRGINSDNLIVWGSKKNQQNPKWSVNATVPNPSAVYKTLLSKRLAGAGIKVEELKIEASTPSKTLYIHNSPSLRDLCRDLMKRSDNLFAEGILRALQPNESRKKCLKREKDFWIENGVDANLTIINDGSGLTRANRISPIFLGNILEYMYKSNLSETFIDLFPISGIDGTLKNFLENTRLKGRLALKTGSVSNVQSYAGYRLDSEGKATHIVVIMVNGFTCPRKELKKSIENYLLNIFENI